MSERDPSPITGTPSGAPRKPISRERMALLFAVMLTTAAGNTAMQSVMPSIGTELGVEDVWISLAYTWSALLWVICAPIWARRSDKRGRKSMMALGMVGFVLSMGLCGIVLWFGLIGALPAVWTLLFFAAARSLYGGFGSAAPPAVQAYVASRTARSQRTQALSLIASSFGLGTVLGPALAPLLVFPGLGLTGPFAAFTILGLVTLIALRILLPDDEPQFPARGKAFGAPFGASSHGSADQAADDSTEEQDNLEPRASPEPVKKLSWFEPRLRPWVITGLLGGHAHAMILGISGFFVMDRLGLREVPLEAAAPIGIVLMVGALATLSAQWGIIPILKLGPRAATLWGIAVAGFGVLMFGVAQSLYAICISYAIVSLGFGLFRPGFTAGSSLAVTRAEQGEASGAVASINGAAFVFAPALGVLLYNWSEWIGFAIIVAICLAVLLFGWRSLALDEETTRDHPA